METSQKFVWVSSGDIHLEGVLHLPQGEGPFPGIVVCHPHPQYGGSMSNNVVLAVCKAAIGVSMAALRFNFRGVGGSGGSYAEGVGEQEDVIAAVDFLSSVPELDPKRIGVVGYSFGATVALPASVRDDRVQSLVLISPPITGLGWKPLEQYAKPCLILCGTEDEFLTAPPTSLQSQCEAIPGVDHFWWGYEAKLGSKVSAFLSSSLG